MGRREIEAFLSHLALDLNVSASTQNQAVSALLFLYRHVLNLDLDEPVDALRVRRPERVPAVMTREEALAVINTMSGKYQCQESIGEIGNI